MFSFAVENMISNNQCYQYRQRSGDRCHERLRGKCRVSHGRKARVEAFIAGLLDRTNEGIGHRHMYQAMNRLGWLICLRFRFNGICVATLVNKNNDYNF